VFNQGLDASREDAFQSPPSDGKVWVSKSELSEGTVELIEHVVIEGIAEIAKHVFKRAALGLAGVVLTVLQLLEDTPL
jgi:hypothetical protein